MIIWPNIKTLQNIMTIISAFCINIKAFNRINRKQLIILKTFLNIWKFILLLTEDDSALEVAWRITFRWLVAFNSVAYIKRMYMKSYNDTGDSVLMSRPNIEFPKDCFSSLKNWWWRFKITFTLCVTGKKYHALIST